MTKKRRVVFRKASLATLRRKSPRELYNRIGKISRNMPDTKFVLKMLRQEIEEARRQD
jgi:hypothetical protein